MINKNLLSTIITVALMALFLSCSSQKYHTNTSTPSKDDNNYHLKTANKIVDETSSNKASRERKAERERKRYNRRKEKQEEQEKKMKSSKSKTYKDKKSSGGKVPLY